MSRLPQVSILMATMNHERFIEESIQSCLNQTFDDLEVIVVDDGSSDRTFEIAKSIKDPRLYVHQKKNGGPSMTLNYAYKASKAPYVAILSGDDACNPQRIERQLSLLNSVGPNTIVFSYVEGMNDDGQPVDSANGFNQPLPSRPEILRRFFESGNFLCAPTAFMHRSTLETCGLFHPGYFQLQDYELWIRLIKKYEFAIVPEALVRYRVHGKSLSSASRRAELATALEFFLIMQDFFTGIDPELMRAAFGEREPTELLLSRPRFEQSLWGLVQMLKQPDLNEQQALKIRKQIVQMGKAFNTYSAWDDCKAAIKRMFR